MKITFSLFLLLNNYAFSQCPQSGLKIISKDCENPKGLAVTFINCTEMKVKWLGNKGQTYIVKASASNTDNASATTINASKVIYDNNGNYTASLAVTEGTTINWGIETLCTLQDITTFSEAVSGPETYVPICNKVRETNSTSGLQAYPNPSKGMLTVNYAGRIESSLQISVYDVTGKKAFTRNEAASLGKTNQFQLNLQYLTPGTYMLETVNGTEVKKMKFVIL